MKLHIGGKEIKDGWKILNAQQFSGVDYLGDIRDLSQFGDNSCEEVYASHVLEHVPHNHTFDALKGIHRILIQGGKFFVSVPDLDILCRTYINPITKPDQKLAVMKMMFGAQEDEYDFHYVGWNQEFLYHFLKLVGFSKIERVGSFGIFQDYSEYRPFGFPISLNMIASK